MHMACYVSRSTPYENLLGRRRLASTHAELLNWLTSHALRWLTAHALQDYSTICLMASINCCGLSRHGISELDLSARFLI